MLALVALSALSLAPVDYDTSLVQLEQRRQALSAAWKKDKARARAEARQALLGWFDAAAFPAWSGTPWAYSGTSTTPGVGAIACGYFVTTLYEAAGVRLERVTLAQQASAWLVTSVARGSAVEWIRPRDASEALSAMRKRFPNGGLLVVGFDLHAGFVRLDGDQARFCHASYLGTAAVVCEDPLTSGAFVSSLYVAADGLSDQLLDDWLLGRAVPSILPKRPRRA